MLVIADAGSPIPAKQRMKSTPVNRMSRGLMVPFPIVSTALSFSRDSHQPAGTDRQEQDISETDFILSGRIVLYVTRTGTIFFMVTLCRQDLPFFRIIPGASW
jgi:hypothetical protein